jgi:Phage P22-like portal protein
MPEKDKKERYAELVERALECFRLSADADSQVRSDCLDDLQFSIGEQWPMNIRSQRELDGRPCLTMDQIQQSIRQVCNEYRQQRPALEINPVGSGADVDIADIIQGIVRHIEVNSDAELAYDGAHEQVVRTGYQGSWRIISDYAREDGDAQEIFIVPIRNNFSVYWQPGVPNDKAGWCLIIFDIPWETYKEDYKESQIASLADFTATGNSAPDWATKEYVRVCEFFEVTETKGKGKRPKKKVKWYKLNAIEVLDEEDLPGTSIPIFSAYGDDLDIDGKRHVAGLVRNAKDPQRMYNYWNSAATEAIALAPKAPWLVVEGQLAGRETEWEQSNVRNTAVLTYKAIDVAGKPAPPPGRNSVEPPIQAMSVMIQQASLDLKASTGLYDPSLGQRKGDSSGKAIERLQEQGNTATLNYSDNMARAMRRFGKVLIEWIQVVYDAPRIQRIINPDGTTRHVIVHNGPEQAGEAQGMATEDIKKVYDIGTGQYDVTVSVGPSYQTKRQEAVATQMDLLKTLPPQVAMNIADLTVRNMDIPQANEIADRLKKMLPPNLQEDDDDPKTQLIKAQAQLQQLSQQHQLLAKVAQEQAQVIKDKQIEAQGKVQIEQAKGSVQMQIAKMNNDTKLAVAEVMTQAQSSAERLTFVKDVLTEMHGDAHELAMGEQAHQQALEQGAQQAAAGSAQSTQDHGESLAEGQQGAANTSAQSAQDAAQQQAAAEAAPKGE